MRRDPGPGAPRVGLGRLSVMRRILRVSDV
ncbi:hypothetical protein AFLA70_372g001351 [Aspergillus flavus AF70]|nr:hypothetical protein AFLA70_372g001351 [Aspergillus flavus AF70]